jgi:hypothetical protein
MISYGRLDPILSPGAVSAHVHQISGANAMQASYDYDTLRRESTCSSVVVQEDLSNYWAPAMYHYDGASNYSLMLARFSVYYLFDTMSYSATNKSGVDQRVAFPEGLVMLAGDMYKRNASNAVTAFQCQRASGNSPYSPDMRDFQKSGLNCDQSLRATINMPSCWDGVADNTDLVRIYSPQVRSSKLTISDSCCLPIMGRLPCLPPTSSNAHRPRVLLARAILPVRCRPYRQLGACIRRHVRLRSARRLRERLEHFPPHTGHKRPHLQQRRERHRKVQNLLKVEQHADPSLHAFRPVSKRTCWPERHLPHSAPRLQPSLDGQLDQANLRQHIHSTHQPQARSRPQRLQLRLLPLRLHLHRPHAHQPNRQERRLPRRMPRRLLQLYLHRRGAAARR